MLCVQICFFYVTTKQLINNLSVTDECFGQIYCPSSFCRSRTWQYYLYQSNQSGVSVILLHGSQKSVFLCFALCRFYIICSNIKRQQNKRLMDKASLANTINFRLSQVKILKPSYDCLQIWLPRPPARNVAISIIFYWEILIFAISEGFGKFSLPFARFLFFYLPPQFFE